MATDVNDTDFSKDLLHPRYWPIWIAFGFLRLFLLLPYPWVQAISLWLGYKVGGLFKRRREIVRVNAELCFPEFTPAQQKQFIDDVLANTLFGFIETLYSWWASDKAIAKRSKLEGLELIEQAHQEGRGVILIGAHFTTLDLSGRVFVQHHDADVTYRKQDNKAYNFIVNNGRKDYFESLIEKRQMRRMIKRLKAGKVVWYATDQDYGRKDSVFAPFFGVPACTVTTLDKLLRLTGAKPLFYSHVREGMGKNTCYIGRISDPYQEQFSDDEVANATLLNKVLEDCLRANPSQYLWVHRRFKTRPDPREPKFYHQKKRKPKKQ